METLDCLVQESSPFRCSWALSRPHLGDGVSFQKLPSERETDHLEVIWSGAASQGDERWRESGRTENPLGRLNLEGHSEREEPQGLRAGKDAEFTDSDGWGQRPGGVA